MLQKEIQIEEIEKYYRISKVARDLKKCGMGLLFDGSTNAVAFDLEV